MSTLVEATVHRYLWRRVKDVALLVAGTNVCCATASEALLRANTPIKTSDSPSRSPVCGATNTLVKNYLNFSAVNMEALYLSETIIPIHTALLTYHNVY
jgi:hypothetical protein